MPSDNKFPLTSNVMVVNREGDLELYEIHDTPTHSAWSPRGDLTMGVARSYTNIVGFQSRPTDQPLDSWDLPQPSVPPSAAHSVDRFTGRERSGARSGNNSPPLFGRGDEDGFPALKSAPANLAATRPSGRPYTPLALKGLQFDYKSGSKPDGATEHGPKAKHQHSRRGRERDASTKRLDPTELLQNNIEGDISIIMQYRVTQSYGLGSVSAVLFFVST